MLFEANHLLGAQSTTRETQQRAIGQAEHHTLCVDSLLELSEILFVPTMIVELTDPSARIGIVKSAFAERLPDVGIHKPGLGDVEPQRVFVVHEVEEDFVALVETQGAGHIVDSLHPVITPGDHVLGWYAVRQLFGERLEVGMGPARRTAEDDFVVLVHFDVPPREYGLSGSSVLSHRFNGDGRFGGDFRFARPVKVENGLWSDQRPECVGGQLVELDVMQCG